MWCRMVHICNCAAAKPAGAFSTHTSCGFLPSLGIPDGAALRQPCVPRLVWSDASGRVAGDAARAAGQHAGQGMSQPPLQHRATDGSRHTLARAECLSCWPPSPSLAEPCLLPRSVAQEAAEELSAYWADSFGNPVRIDYGTGHETTFAALLFCLAKLGALTEDCLQVRASQGPLAV